MDLISIQNNLGWGWGGLCQIKFLTYLKISYCQPQFSTSTSTTIKFCINFFFHPPTQAFLIHFWRRLSSEWDHIRMYKSCWCRMFTCLTQFSPLCVASIIIMSFTKLPETGSACPRARRIYNLQTRCLLSWCSAWPPGESQVLCSIGSPLLGS